MNHDDTDHSTSPAVPSLGSRLAVGCTKAEPPTPELVAPVRVAPAIKGSIRLIVNADAVLFPRDQANIVPKISAPVRRFLVNRGDHVKQGQLLAELESRDLAAPRRRAAGSTSRRSRTTARRPRPACRSR